MTENATEPRSVARRIAVIATLDTKGEEARFVAEQITARGHVPVLVDLGLVHDPTIEAAVTRAEIDRAAGGVPAPDGDRMAAMARAARGAGFLVNDLVGRGEIHGAIAIGGGSGAWMATEIMNTMPLAFPKVLVTTVVKSDGRRDITFIPSVVDIAGMNRVLVPILVNAVGAVCGMAEQPPVERDAARRTIAMTMFGVTTEGGAIVRRHLEEAGCEVVVFHATGAGGATMEDLTRAGMFDAVVDWTTSEVTDEVVGGICTSGPDRLEAAGQVGVPQVIVPGAIDVINILAPIPERFESRTHHMHLPTVPLIRTSASESAEIGGWIARKLNAAIGPTMVIIPRGGFSSLDIEGGAFRDTAANAAFETALRDDLRSDIPVLTDPHHINSESFARHVADATLKLIASSPRIGASHQKEKS